MLSQLPYLILYFCCVVQLLQNIVKATELHFPPDAKILSADCKDLCQKLLRRNPGMSKKRCIWKMNVCK